MAENTRNGLQGKVGQAVVAQVVAYVVLIAAGGIAGLAGSAVAAGVVGVAALAVLAVFEVFWPFRATKADRVATAVFGVISLVCALWGTFADGAVEDVVFADGAQTASDGAGMSVEFWLLAAGVLLMALVVFSFGRQMAREERSHLIRSLSHAVTSGIAAITVFGWCFLPTLCELMGAGSVVAIVGAVVAVVLAVLLGIASAYWVRDADPDPAAKRPWIGIALLPVCLTGALIAAAVFLTLLVL